MRHLIDIEKWNRKEHFHFYKSFAQPFFGLTVQVDVTELVAISKDLKLPLFLVYMHKSLKAFNAVPNLKLRFEGEDVYAYDIINVSATIGRPDKTFGFSFMDYYDDISEFCKHGQIEVERVSSMQGLCLTDTTERLDTVHASSLPWLQFTSLDHAQFGGNRDGIPKVCYGKITKGQDGRMYMPMSLHAHHALADGYDISLYFEEFEKSSF